MNIENPNNVSRYGHERTVVWKQFCEFTKKTESFTQNDAAEFFESLLKRLSLNGVYRKMRRLVGAYNEEMGKRFSSDFPNIPINKKEIQARFDNKNTEHSSNSLSQEISETKVESADTNTKSDKDNCKSLSPTNDSTNRIEIEPQIPKMKMNMGLNKKEIWKQFCQFTQKTENFTQKEAAEFFESLLDSERFSLNGLWNRMKHLAGAYNIKIGNQFSSDFPDVPITKTEIQIRFDEKKFEKSPQTKKKLKATWKKFCKYTKKTENFVENEVIDFFESLMKCISFKELYRQIRFLVRAYFNETKRQFVDDFPNVPIMKSQMLSRFNNRSTEHSVPGMERGDKKR